MAMDVRGLLGRSTLIMAALPLIATSALAQESPPAGAQAQAGTASQAERTTIEEVVVLAQKREQSLQDVPLSMAAIGAGQLEQVAAVSLLGLNGLTPNVVVEPVGLFPAAASLSMRGVGYSGIESFVDPDVAVYVNGVYQARNSVALSSTVDVEAVEVLRGPQGTLYGRNAYAGVVALRTNRPDLHEASGNAAATIGNYGRVDMEFVGNVPLVDDRVGARIAIRSHNLDGFYRNHGRIDAAGTIDATLEGERVGKEKNLYVRPSLRFTPNEDWDINFIGEWYRERSKAYAAQNGPGSPGIAGQGFPGVNPFGDKSRGIPGDGSSPFRIGYSLEDRPADYDSWFLVNDTSYNTGFGTVRGIFSYMDVKEDVWADTDGENINYFSSARAQDYKAWTGELQFVSDFSDRINLVAGVTYLWDKYNTTQLSFTDFAAPFPDKFTPFSVNPSYINNTGKRKAAAAYAQVEFHVTDPLSFVLGGRYSWEKKYGYYGQNTTLSAAGFPPTIDYHDHIFSSNPAIVFNMPKDTWSNFAPRAGVNFKAGDDLMLYAFWQRAYKSGGVNAGSSDRFAFETPYGEEKVDSFEGGFKSEWLDNRLRVNLNFFYSLFGNLQRTLVTPSPTAPSGVTSVITNVADLKSYGVELELALQPMPDLRLFANIGWNKAYYTDYCADLDGAEATTTPASGRTPCGGVTTVPTAAGPRYLVPTDYTDLEPVRAPRWDTTAGFTKDFRLASGTIQLNGSANYRSHTWANLTNTPYSYREPLFVIDASIAWQPESGRYSVTVWGRNLNNDVELLNIVPVATLFSFQHPTPPRTYGVTLRANF